MSLWQRLFYFPTLLLSSFMWPVTSFWCFLSWSWGGRSGKYKGKVLLELIIDLTGDLGTNRQLILVRALSWSFRASDGHSVLQLFWPRWMYLYYGLRLVLLSTPGIWPSHPGSGSFYSSAPLTVILNRPMMALSQHPKAFLFLWSMGTWESIASVPWNWRPSQHGSTLWLNREIKSLLSRQWEN